MTQKSLQDRHSKSTNDIYDLLEPVDTVVYSQPRAYVDKYIHDVPDTICFQREKFLLAVCKDKTVLHIGSNGVFNSLLEKTAKEVYSIDIDECDNKAKNFKRLDVEKEIPEYSDVDIVLASDILEHLSNPGLFLENLQHFNCKIIISVPNAFCKAGLDWMVKNKENVHRDHVAYYSYNTFKALIERYGFRIDLWYWYNGLPRIAEGLMFILEKKK